MHVCIGIELKFPINNKNPISKILGDVQEYIDKPQKQMFCPSVFWTSKRQPQCELGILSPLSQSLSVGCKHESGMKKCIHNFIYMYMLTLCSSLF